MSVLRLITTLPESKMVTYPEWKAQRAALAATGIVALVLAAAAMVVVGVKLMTKKEANEPEQSTN